MIRIIGRNKCNDTKKAIRYFKERNIKFQFMNLNERELTAGELNNIFRLVPPDEAVEISADKKELKRAITNLITNTYKHNPSGIKVLVKLHRNENAPELIIADSGNEIPKDMNIFEPFVTENKARSIGGGTGLGLAITKRIIDEHKAKISIREDIPEYTKAFVVTFCDKQAK